MILAGLLGYAVFWWCCEATAPLLVGWVMVFGVMGLTVSAVEGPKRLGLHTDFGVVTTKLEPEGKVRIGAEIWNARAEGGAIAEGERVRVVSRDGLTLVVEPVRESASLQQ